MNPNDYPLSKVLIIEDEALIAWMLQSILEDMGFNDIDVASNGAEALRLAREHLPRLIISDINLGIDPDGIMTSSEILAGVHIPLIFVSANADQKTQDRIMALLPHAALLRKPIKDATLAKAIGVALEKE